MTTALIQYPANPDTFVDQAAGSNPRVLLSAYQCGPGMGSVSQIGWHWYSRLAKRLPVTLFTHIRNRAPIDAAGGPIGDSSIQYIDTEWFAGPLYKFASRLFRGSEHGTFMVSSLDYFVFDRSLIRAARKAMQDGTQWDLAHAVTPVSPLAATGLHRLGLPVIVGPWNGHLRNPEGFDDILRRDAAWLYPVRAAGRSVDELIGCSRNARAILTATQATRKGVAPRYQHKCLSMLENGVDPATFTTSEWPDLPGQDDTPLRLVFVGRLLPVKGVDMLLEAISKSSDKGLQVLLTIVGEGTARSEWQALTERFGLEGCVKFLGSATPGEVAREISNSHALFLPSIRESGGAVLLEAMACGRPVVAFDFGGPAEIVNDEVGRLLSAKNRESLITALQATIDDIFANPEAWQARGRNGRRMAEQRYSWDAKIDDAIALYRDILGAGPQASLRSAQGEGLVGRVS